MKTTTFLACGVLAMVLAARGAAAGEPDVAALIREFKGETAAAQRSPPELKDAYAAVIDHLLPDMGADDLGKRAAAQGTFETICLRAGRPGAEAERTAVCQAIAEKVGGATSVEAKVWLIRQLQYVGRAESVAALALLLEEKEPLVRDAARRALQANPSPEAAEALRAALLKADTPEWRVALLNALGSRQEPSPATAAALAKCLADKNESVAAAAAIALGKTGGPEAHRALMAAKATAAGKLRPVILDALLTHADRLLAENKKAEAFAVFRDLSDASNPDRVRQAALRGMVMAKSEGAATVLTEVITGKDTALRSYALTLVSEVPGAAATKAFAALVPKLAGRDQAVLIGQLAARGDAQARPAVLEALKSADAEVRLAAVRAMADLGGPADVLTLAQMAASTEDDKDRAPIVESLVRLKGKEVDAAMVKALESPNPKVRGEIVRAIAARKVESAAPALIKATADPDEAVRIRAAAALGSLGDEKALPALAALLPKATADEDRAAVEQAMASICTRSANKDAAAQAVLSAAATARGQTKAAFIGLAGKTASPRALEAIRAAMKDADPVVQEAALRALSEWPDATPAAELLTIAKTDARPNHQVLALRGFIRMASTGQYAQAERSQMYRDALAAARRPEEKKMVLAAVAESPSASALEVVKTCLADAELKAEAAAAAVKVAKALTAANPEEAKAVLKQVLEVSEDETVKKQAQDALNAFEKFDDYIVTWMLSGPYAQEGKDGAALFDVAFPPEEGDGSKAVWKPLPQAALDPANPWLVNLAKGIGGDNKAVYLRTYVFSPTAQDAQLQLGSDDGVKAWLNGKLVHANNAGRAVTPGEDKVKVQLAEGWNRLVLKIVNGGGDWGACARFRKLDGAKLAGIRARTEPDK